MEVPLGLLICGGIVGIVIVVIILVALAFGYLLYERVVEYALMFVGLAVAAWIIISIVRSPIHLPFLSPARTPEPTATPAFSKGDIEQAIKLYSSELELLSFRIEGGDTAEIEFKFNSPLSVPDEQITEDSAINLICAVRKYHRQPIPYDLKLLGQGRHKNEYFGYSYTRTGGELHYSASAANRIRCNA